MPPEGVDLQLAGLPTWADPATSALSATLTAASRNAAAGVGIEPSATRSSRCLARDIPTHVDGPVAACDVRNDDVQALPARQARVDEQAGQVEAAADRLPHLLDPVTHPARRKDRCGQVGFAPPGDEHLRRRVDAELHSDR